MELRWKRRVLTVTWRLLSCRRPRGLSSSSSAVSPDLSFSNLLMLAGLANRSVHRLHSNFVANFPFPLRVCLSHTHTRQLVIGWYLKNKIKNKKVIQGVYSPRPPPPAAGDRSRCPLSRVPRSSGVFFTVSLSLSHFSPLLWASQRKHWSRQSCPFTGAVGGAYTTNTHTHADTLESLPQRTLGPGVFTWKLLCCYVLIELVRIFFFF